MYFYSICIRIAIGLLFFFFSLLLALFFPWFFSAFLSSRMIDALSRQDGGGYETIPYYWQGKPVKGYDFFLLFFPLSLSFLIPYLSC